MTDEQRFILYGILDDAEDSRLFPYVDTKGKTTIGIGHNLTDKGISMAVQTILLDEDLDDAERDLNRELPWWRSLDSVRQIAMLELSFNMGIGNSRRGLLSFKNTLAHIKAGQWNAAADGLLASKWAKDVKARRANRVVNMIRTGRLT